VTTWELFLNVTHADRVVLALDLDGTLTRQGTVPSDAASAAARELASAGVMVVLATGRQLHDCTAVVEALDLKETWLVASDGAVMARYEGTTQAMLATRTFDPRPLALALSELDPAISVGAEDVGAGYFVTSRVTWMSKYGHRQRVVDELPQSVTMFTAASTVLSGAELAGVAASLGLSHTGWDEDGWGYLDAAAPGLSKASGVAALVQTAAPSSTFTVAVGDFHNDIALLNWANVGIAMGHAPPEVVAAADHLAGTIDEDGIVDVLQELLAALRR